MALDVKNLPVNFQAPQVIDPVQLQRMQLSQSLFNEPKPRAHNWLGALANVGRDLAEGYVGKQNLDKTEESYKSYREALSKALASGNMDELIQNFGSSPQTQNLAMGMLLNRLGRRDENKDTLALDQGRENIHLTGRGDPEYRGRVAQAEATGRGRGEIATTGDPNYIQRAAKARGTGAGQAEIETTGDPDYQRNLAYSRGLGGGQAQVETTEDPAHLRAAAEARATGTGTGQLLTTEKPENIQAAAYARGLGAGFSALDTTERPDNVQARAQAQATGTGIGQMGTTQDPAHVAAVAAAQREPIEQAAAREAAVGGARERTFLTGRGATNYIASAAAAGREPIDQAAQRAGATAAASRVPLAEVGQRAEAQAAGTARGTGRSRVLTEKEISDYGLPRGSYQQDVHGNIHKIADSDDTVATKNARQLGLTPGTPEWDKYIKDSTTDKAGNTILTNLNAGISKERIKTEGEYVSQNRAMAPRLEQIGLGLESGNVKTGPFRNAFFNFRQYAAEMGWPDAKKNLPEAEAIRGAMAFLAPRMRVVGSGSTSDYEMSEYQKAVPNFKNSPNGNLLMARTMQQVNARNAKAYDLMLKWAQDPKNNGSLAGFEEYADQALGPIFPKWGPDDGDKYEAAAPGTVFYDTRVNEFKVKPTLGAR